jgi:hypothetical protein
MKGFERFQEAMSKAMADDLKAFKTKKNLKRLSEETQKYIFETGEPAPIRTRTRRQV